MWVVITNRVEVVKDEDALGSRAPRAKVCFVKTGKVCYNRA